MKSKSIIAVYYRNGNAAWLADYNVENEKIATTSNVLESKTFKTESAENWIRNFHQYEKIMEANGVQHFESRSINPIIFDLSIEEDRLSKAGDTKGVHLINLAKGIVLNHS